MIELDIKIRAKSEESLKALIALLTTSLQTANKIGRIDVQLSAETDGDTILLTRKEIIKQ